MGILAEHVHPTNLLKSKERSVHMLHLLTT